MTALDVAIDPGVKQDRRIDEGALRCRIPWKQEFQAHVESSPYFALATVDRESHGAGVGGMGLHEADGSELDSLCGKHARGGGGERRRAEVPDGAGAVEAVPRVRFCACRGLWAELKPHPQNPAPPQTGVFTSDMPTFTTDARMEKYSQVVAGSLPTLDLRLPQSGGGAQVEAVWFVASPQIQWRVRGRLFFLGPDIDSDSEPSGVPRVRRELRKRMTRVRKGDRDIGGVLTAGASASGHETLAQDTQTAPSWVWSTEVTAHFGNLSPEMRGEFGYSRGCEM